MGEHGLNIVCPILVFLSIARSSVQGPNGYIVESSCRPASDWQGDHFGLDWALRLLEMTKTKKSCKIVW
jgi:hypothetical protein